MDWTKLGINIQVLSALHCESLICLYCVLSLCLLSVSVSVIVTILTQSADYVMFDAATAISSPSGVTISGITTVTGDDCLVSSSFTWYGAVCSFDDDPFLFHFIA